MSLSFIFDKTCKTSSLNSFINCVISTLLFIICDSKSKIFKQLGVKFWIQSLLFINIKHLFLKFSSFLSNFSVNFKNNIERLFSS